MGCASLFVTIAANVHGMDVNAYFGDACLCLRYRNPITAKPAALSVRLGATVTVAGSTTYDQYTPVASD